MRVMLIATAVLVYSTCVEQGSSRFQNQTRTETWLSYAAHVVSVIQEQLVARCVYVFDNRAVAFGKFTCFMPLVRWSSCVSFWPLKIRFEQKTVLFLSTFQWTANVVTILEILVAARGTGSIFWSWSTRPQTALKTQCPAIRHPCGTQQCNPLNTRGNNYPNAFSGLSYLRDLIYWLHPKLNWCLYTHLSNLVQQYNSFKTFSVLRNTCKSAVSVV